MVNGIQEPRIMGLMSNRTTQGAQCTVTTMRDLHGVSRCVEVGWRHDETEMKL